SIITFFTGIVTGAVLAALNQDPNASIGQYMTELANYVIVGGLCGFVAGSGSYIAACKLNDFRKQTKI
ncbi:MAG: hypothetical protein V1870_05325, partial [Candidatus Aenigmatarchaeota archaeon]